MNNNHFYQFQAVQPATWNQKGNGVLLETAKVTVRILPFQFRVLIALPRIAFTDSVQFIFRISAIWVRWGLTRTENHRGKAQE